MPCSRWSAVLFLCCSLLTHPAAAAPSESEARPEKLYRLDLRARKPAEKEFSRDSRSLVVQVFLDREADRLYYVAEDGKALAVTAAAKDAAKHTDKAARSLHRLLLPVRGWDDKTFGTDTPKVGVEVYRDENNGNLVYVSHTGSLAVVSGPKATAGKPTGEPKWLDRLPLRVREQCDDFCLPTLRCNVEVYRDENSGCVVYVADNGSLAVISPVKGGAGKETREPVWSHALSLKARAYGENDFTNKTAAVTLEVYRDEPRATWVYVTDGLRLAVAPGDKAVAQDKAQPARWAQVIRPGDAKGGKWAAEVFVNPNTGDRLFVTAGGAFAAVADRPIAP
jgi:hypothetical protein